MVTLRIFVLCFLTSVCSKGQAFKNGPQKSTPDCPMLCKFPCLGMGSRDLKGPQGLGPSLNLFPGPQIPETEGDNQGGGGDGAGECPIQVTHERLWKRKGMWTNCCCDHGHHELSTYSMPGIVLSVLPMFFMLALSQAFEVGFITPSMHMRMRSEEDHAYIAQSHLSSKARAQI